MKSQNLSFDIKTNTMLKSYAKSEISMKKKRSISPLSKQNEKYQAQGITGGKPKSRGGSRKTNIRSPNIINRF